MMEIKNYPLSVAISTILLVLFPLFIIVELIHIFRHSMIGERLNEFYEGI